MSKFACMLVGLNFNSKTKHTQQVEVKETVGARLEKVEKKVETSSTLNLTKRRREKEISPRAVGYYRKSGNVETPQTG